MAMFKAFKPSGMEKIARSMGYQGKMEGFTNYLSEDPSRQQQMQGYTNNAIRMARGGLVYDVGGDVSSFDGTGDDPAETGIGTTGGGADAVKYKPFILTDNTTGTGTTGTGTTGTGTTGTGTTGTGTTGGEASQGQSYSAIGDATAQRFQNPVLPMGAAQNPVGTITNPNQDIATGTGQVVGTIAAPIAGATTSYAQAPTAQTANLAEVTQAAPAVDSALKGVQAAQGTVSEDATVTAAQQDESSVSGITAAQGEAILMDSPIQREIQDGELISGAADAQKAAQFTEQIQAATATPTQKATVKGQLTNLMSDFEDGQTPAWAAGAMRAATSAMAARGLGASSLAGQAIIQATMESALPIAQADASIQAQFETQNLSNRQQRAMIAAEQRAKFMGQEFDQAFQSRVQNAGRIADVANMNFTAEQQVALENSRIANTLNLNNLSNRQGVVMAEAAALSQMDMANLSNRQQASVMNAQNFMQMDTANLSNQQQTDMFKAQARTQSLLTDQAAANAASQFNASSQNQVDQFFSNLANNVSQFNTTQANGQAQFNAGQTNSMEKFNSEINNQRDQFNAQNQMVIAQSNATWRRQIATADTTAINRANEINAQSVLAISNQAYANLWQQYGDTMEWAWTSAENAQDRISAMAIADLDAATRQQVAQEAASSAAGTAIGNLIGTLGSAYLQK